MKIFTYIKESSERVKDKNFQLIGNNPLWKICLYKLKDENVYVDTDSEVVLQECNSDDKLSNITAYHRNLEHIQIEEDPN
ncbi:MAG: cytidylyltransferase domain-containing protein, partial [Promethearchaeota archaeon]